MLVGGFPKPMEVDLKRVVDKEIPLAEMERALAAAADKGGGSIKVQVYNPAVPQ